MLAFLRFPKGEQFVEHHHVASLARYEPGAQHTCFETIDVDAVFMGIEYWLTEVTNLHGDPYGIQWAEPSPITERPLRFYFGACDRRGLCETTKAVTAYSPASSEASVLQWTTNPLPSDFIE